MKIKFSQGELKKQRDALRQFERYLPTLQLKKQHIQLEILHQQKTHKERTFSFFEKKSAAEMWAGLLAETPGIGQWLQPEKITLGKRNIAGVEIPVFERLDFQPAQYDLFLTPLWLDTGIEVLRDMIALQEELRALEEGISVLQHELRITTQRVNLFEKVKIPEAREAIRRIKIYLGDQMANAVGRSKIAKTKIEEANFEEVAL